MMLARWIGAPFEESPTPAPVLTIWPGTSSIVEWQDAYPLLRKAVSENPKRSTTRRSSATRCSYTSITTSPNRAGTILNTTGGSASAPT
jgi:hypothetical protein